jgi:hypothetical protein
LAGAEETGRFVYTLVDELVEDYPYRASKATHPAILRGRISSE